MKRTILTTLLVVNSFIGFAQTQDIMVIEKKDNTTLRLSIDDIKRVVFESAYVNPTGKKAEAIDLGLPSGVKWASWNLGASSPTDYGGYYGWADSSGTKSSTNLNDYPSDNPPSEISGTNYDVAKALWGEQWRLPTYDDIVELYETCKFYKSGNNIEIVGTNGNSIILPLAGSREGAEIYDTVNYGYYWSGSICQEDNTYAWLLNFDMNKGTYGIAAGSRYFGLSVRPVWGEPVKISVHTVNETSITENCATISGWVYGVSSPVTVGFVYGTSSSVTFATGTKWSTTSDGGFSVRLTDLIPGTTYYYFAYAEVDGQRYEGDKKQFTTKAPAVSVTTGSVTNITDNSATATGTISGVSSAVTVGIVYSSSTSFTFDTGSKKTTTSNGSFSLELTGLSSSTTYYYRAYAEVDGKHYEGETKQFTTQKGYSGTLNGHEWVDLGLPSGVKWATCNVGASSETGYGDYYAWGETYTKNGFWMSNYDYYGSSSIPSNISGTSYDVAHNKWGSTWRMPTFTEVRELANNCSFEWTTINGVNGAKLTGPNGKSIFIPAGGAMGQGFKNGASSVTNRGEWGYYWSATINYRQNGNDANVLEFKSDGIKLRNKDVFGNYEDANIQCFNGLLIRPVTN